MCKIIKTIFLVDLTETKAGEGENTFCKFGNSRKYIGCK